MYTDNTLTRRSNKEKKYFEFRNMNKTVGYNAYRVLYNLSGLEVGIDSA